MADLNSFWHLFIMVTTVVGLVGCFWLLQANASGVSKDQAEQQTHIWDENLTEYNNPLPRWWYNMFMITLIFGAIYLALYPGLGTFKGYLGWSSVGQYEKEMAAADEQFGPLYAKYAAVDIEALSQDEEALRTGRRLFSTYCTTCHGSDGRGADQFPNLRDEEWLYGGTPDMIKTSIMDGRQGAMPGWSASMQPETLDAVVAFVQSLSTGEGDAEKIAAGQQSYNMFCVGCHAADGTGNIALGAPDLTNDIWLYGGSTRQLLETVQNGRSGKMPAHRDFLGEDKVHLLTAYVYSLGK